MTSQIKGSTFLSWRSTWKLGLIVMVTLIAIGVSFGFALQGKTLEGLLNKGGSLSLRMEGHQDAPLLSLRRPDQLERFWLHSSDLDTQIDGIDTYSQVDAYLARQDQIIHILDSPSVLVGIRSPNGDISEINVKVRPLRVSEFSQSFWVSLSVGLTAFLVGGCVWCLKPHEKVTRLLAVNGFGMLVAATSSCVTFAQPLTLSGSAILAFNTINHAGTVIFGLTLVAIFLLFPKRLISDRHYHLVMAAGIPLFLLDTFRLLGLPYGLIIFCFVVIVAVIVLVAVQFYNARAAPDAHAALLWLALAGVVSGGSWGVIVAAYMMQGQFQNMPESYIFLSFLILYIGIAVGVARFRLFDIGDWSFRIFFFTVAALLFIGLDAGLIYVVGLAQSSALAIALLVVAFGYLPCRDFLWRRFVRSETLSDNEMLSSVLDMAFAVEAPLRQSQWQLLLHKLFQPLSIAPASDAVHETYVDEDSLHLYVPENMDAPALRLSYPQSGRGLFSPRHVQLVDQILRLSRKAMLALNAYERGAAEQRHRLAQDLHDDVGAKLVSGLTVANAASRPFIYGALNDIREIASALITESAPLDRIIAEVRHEAVRRLDAARIGLDWPLWPEDAPYAQMTSLQKKALTSSVREVFTNIIKHSGAKQVQVALRLEGHRLTVRLSDDGAGFPDTVIKGLSSGQGLRSITDRLDQTNGKVRFANLTNGAVVDLELSLVTQNELSVRDGL